MHFEFTQPEHSLFLFKPLYEVEFFMLEEIPIRMVPPTLLPHRHFQPSL